MLNTRQWRRFLARKELKAYKKQQAFLSIQSKGRKFFALKTGKDKQYEFEAKQREVMRQASLEARKAKKAA